MDSASIRIILAIDYGARRTGLAIGQTLTATSIPLKTLHHKWHQPDWTSLKVELEKWLPQLIILGYPQYLDEQTSTANTKHIGRYILKFHDRLRRYYDGNIEFIDESYSSVDAWRRLKNLRRRSIMKRAIRRGDIDSHAASILLDSWLDQASSIED